MSDRLSVYREIFHRFPDALILLDGRGRCVDQNAASRRLLGYDDDELSGRPAAAFLGHGMNEDLRRALRERGSYRSEAGCRKRDGDEIRIDLAAFALPDADSGNGPFSLLEVTPGGSTAAGGVADALHTSEEKCRAVLESSPDPVVTYDMDGSVTFINPAFTRVFGWNPAEVIGRRIDFVPEENRPETLEMVRSVLEGRGFSNVETRRRTRHGGVVDVSISGAIFRDPDGTPRGSVVTLRDITEKKRVGARVNQAQRLEAIGTLAGGIAHDFNNILQAISGYCQLLLLDADPSGDTRDSLRAIEKAAERASELTRHLLVFGRKVHSELRSVDLNVEVRQVAEVLRRTIPKMIAVETDLAEGLFPVAADPAQMEQILMNLGVNARDAMADGGTLAFQTRNLVLDGAESGRLRLPAPGPFVRLRVTDTGCGMTDDVRRRIFEPFFTTRAVGRGTGLGLALVYGIVEGHGGTISCHSTPGGGTRFAIYFPALATEGGRPGDGPQSRAGVQGDEVVLLVDDEPVIVDIGRKILERFGYRVLTAESGEAALDRYRRRGGEIDLIVLDLNMPGMGGNRCLTALRRLNPAARIVVASGYEKDAVESEADGFIAKPFKIMEMLNTIRRLLDA